MWPILPQASAQLIWPPPGSAAKLDFWLFNLFAPLLGCAAARCSPHGSSDDAAAAVATPKRRIPSLPALACPQRLLQTSLCSPQSSLARQCLVLASQASLETKSLVITILKGWISLARPDALSAQFLLDRPAPPSSLT
ncbi:uncharacterized protein TrAFT101_002799 [Trichoderma asperellum]|uniref:Uncharacterized protein n=1 Tax=Trichoderma asperellum (strain ATCC 204424 / CBS 433.97 / NBRC 101777) TaxID=1042311 RepID=A0A2T3ZHF4_TRIA4|nr:hypothetical protein M441DRAFT_344572 [Trichoderma asperellum CBS 433.97]PTB44239.1 hypothetical protein M441DRAFT_344572 [Trichoderma asperellum CBS 433.97]UKZ86984.1 hypothetical protein TrAFT101_002799 [Trichoderma asperellum]